MSSNPRMRPLGDFVRLLSGNTPSKADESYWNGDTPWISAKDMGNFWIEDSEDHLTPAGVSAASRLVSPGTVLMLTRGMTLHKRVPICRTAKAATFNQDVKAVLPREGLSARFLPYLLVGNHDRLHERVDAAGHGTGRLNTDALLAFPVCVPAPFEQDAIASIGEVLDERLRLLRETNATLEAIAQALFKSWFVDFDPVRAKMAGRAPDGMDEATAALFPDALEETEWGLMPRGWHVSRVGDVAEVVKGKSYSSKDLVASHDTALVTLKSFERGGGFRMDGFKPYVGAYKPTQVVQAGDLIVAYTDVTQAAELIGKPAIVVGVDAFSTLVASLDVGIVRPEPARSTKLFLYGLFNTDAFQAHTLAHTSGTTVLHLAKDGVGSFLFPCPPMALIERFENVASALMTRKQVHSDAVSTLSKLRDTLLPRLISGQLRLPEANALAAEPTAH